VKAVIQPKPGKTCTQEGLCALVKEKLGSVKTPKRIDFTEQLPRSPVGKILKTEIRKQYWQDLARAVN
jgi:acyl-coenzyme A synthetase/AMP-(fatty) acid ligase